MICTGVLPKVLSNCANSVLLVRSVAGLYPGFAGSFR